MIELKRVLKDTGTMFINFGDTYSTLSGNMKSGMKEKQINSCVEKSIIPSQ